MSDFDPTTNPNYNPPGGDGDGSGGIYELTDNANAELIQQISAANGSDNHLVYEEASIVSETETILYHAYYDLQHDVNVESMQDGFYVPSPDYLFAASMVSGFRGAKIDIVAEFDVNAEELNRSNEQHEYSANEIFVIISDADNQDINGGYQLSSESYKGDLQFYTDYYQSNFNTQNDFANPYGYDGGEMLLYPDENYIQFDVLGSLYPQIGEKLNYDGYVSLDSDEEPKFGTDNNLGVNAIAEDGISLNTDVEAIFPQIIDISNPGSVSGSSGYGSGFSLKMHVSAFSEDAFIDTRYDLRLENGSLKTYEDISIDEFKAQRGFDNGGNTDNLPADGSILLLSEQIGMIDANVYLFKNTEDGVSLERLNKADPTVDNEYVVSDGIYELTDSSDSELIQQISAANGSDNHLVYEEASIVAGNTDDIDAKATFTASIDKWQSNGMGDWMDGPTMKLYRKDVADPTIDLLNEGIDLTAKDGHPGHKHKPDMDKGSYELLVEHDQQTDGAIDMEDVEGVLSLSRGKSSPASKEHKLAADWNGDGIIDIDDVMGVLARSRGKSKEDEWRFHDKTSDTSLWDNATKTNKMDIVLDQDDQIDLTAILRGDVNASYDAGQHNRADPSPAPTPNYAPLPMNNDDELLSLQVDLI